MPKEPIRSEQEREKAFLIAVEVDEDGGWTASDSLEELAALARTAGAEVVGEIAQKRDSVHPNWYLGRGKAAELTEAKGRTSFDLLIADDELSPKQQRSLEDLLNVKVLDRSGLILDIFAQRARTHEGRLQVELAQLEYQLPRLTRLWTHLSRTAGGIGIRRGPGETQLETDRRVIRERIKKMKQRVEEVRRRRETAARARSRSLMPTVAIVGYTNAGKSTLLNALVGSDVVLSEDKLFATLDPTSRRVSLGEGQSVIISDTVGFIHKLPHKLIDAFRATLEEVTRADILIEVVDASDEFATEHRRTVQTVLDELDAGHKPRVIVYNKIDLTPDGPEPIIPRSERRAIALSALTGEGLSELKEELSRVLGDLWVEVDVALPYSAGELLARVRQRGSVHVDYRDADVRVKGRVSPPLAAELQAANRSWLRALRRAEIQSGTGASAAGDGG
jgi:GTP-binding protein HflX